MSLDRDVLPAGEFGEIEFRGPTVTAGYWNDPEATSAAVDAGGWLATGDLGRLDEDGYLFLVDRKKELILRGGYSVYPREVEEVLYEHPDVLEFINAVNEFKTRHQKPFPTWTEIFRVFLSLGYRKPE